MFDSVVIIIGDIEDVDTVVSIGISAVGFVDGSIMIEIGAVDSEVIMIDVIEIVDAVVIFMDVMDPFAVVDDAVSAVSVVVFVVVDGSISKEGMCIYTQMLRWFPNRFRSFNFVLEFASAEIHTSYP